MRTEPNYKIPEWNSGLETYPGRWPKAFRVAFIFVGSGVAWAILLWVAIAWAAVLRDGS
jgi:hypothetical protein